MKTTNTQRTRRTIIAAILILAFAVSAIGVYAFANRWFYQTNKDDNTVKIDQPVVVVVSGDASNGTIMPGSPTSSVKTIFDISIEGDGVVKYALVIRNIQFKFDTKFLNEDNLKDIGLFDDANELEAIFGDDYTDFDTVIDEGAFAAFLSEFRVSVNGATTLLVLKDGVVLIDNLPSVTELKNQTVAISATGDLQLIARGGTLTFTLALEAIAE